MRSNILSPQSVNRIWMLMLVLSPLAYLGGLYLHQRNNAEMQVPLEIDRDEAAVRAREYLKQKGINTQDWQSFISTDASTRLFYFRIKGAEVQKQIAKFFPAVIINVLFLAPENTQNVEVYLASDGQVLGFQRRFKESEGGADIPDDKARQIARERLPQRPEFVHIPETLQPVVAEDRINGSVIRRYKWEWQHPAAPELKAETEISLRGDQVVGENLTARYDEHYRQQIFGDPPLPLFVLGGIYMLLVLVVIIYGVFRFTERLRQKEVSFLRILLIAAGVTIAFGGFVVISDVTQYKPALEFVYNQTAFLNPVFGLITWGFIGLFIGFAYGSGEGDLRELYPGKLTSLDALLTGKWFAQNVAQAVIQGVAMSGWLFLLSHLLVAPFTSRPGYGWRLTSLEPFYANWPWISLLTNWFSFAVLSVIFTILLPLPLLQRRFKKKWLILGCLFLIALDANSITQMQAVRPWGLALILSSLAALTMLVAFFRFDVLTAIIALSASDLIAISYTLLAKPAPAIHRSGIVTTFVVVTALILALWTYFKGRYYREDEVRPMYASNLAERLSLQAEVSAAREAQIRLLPDKLPEMRQLSVAAVCQPAHEVGGDFYDLFELEPNKLGIFMAEGGGRGLPAALTIAFAKGFLMPKIKSDTLSDNSPTEIVRGLQTQLTRSMAQDEVMGFVYAVIDTSDQTLRYAGTGDFPRPQIRGTAQTTVQAAEESEILFRLDAERSFRVTEGFYSLAQGDTVLMLSDGVMKMLTDDARQDSFWESIQNHTASSYRLRDSIMDIFQAKARRKNQVADDLTAVVVQLQSSEPNS